MSDLPDYLKATGLTWTPMVHRNGGDAYCSKDVRGYEIDVVTRLDQGEPYTMVTVVRGIGIYSLCHCPDLTKLSEVIASGIVQLHLPELCDFAHAGGELPFPNLPVPLLAPFNAALREQLPTALAAQSRVTEALVSLGLALGMTSDALCIDLVELT